MFRIKSSELGVDLARLRRQFTARRGPIGVALTALIAAAALAVWVAVAHDSELGLLISAVVVWALAWAIIRATTSEGRGTK